MAVASKPLEHCFCPCCELAMSVVFNFTDVAFQLRAMEIEVFGHSSRLFIYAIEQVFFQYRSESIGLKAVDESVLLLLFWHNFFHQLT